MMKAPDSTLPKQCGSWADVKAAYRLLSTAAVEPAAIQAPHRAQTLAACAEHPVVLSIQDTTELELTSKAAMRGRGQLGGGTSRGLLQHAALAVVPSDDEDALDGVPGRLLGVLDQRWSVRAEPGEGETLRQLQQRRTDADVWLETASAVAALGSTPTRLIHVGDRHCDIFRFFTHCRTLGHGFVVRARYDRALAASDEAPAERLFASLEQRAEQDRQTLTVHEQRTGKGQVRCRARRATLAIRYEAVTLSPPANDPRTRGAEPWHGHAVMVEECDAPADTEPLRWVLLTSEPVRDAAEAWRIVRYYRHRWLIEEWHRVLKEGCRVEAAQFDDAADVQRLAAIKGVIATRLLQLRDLAAHAGDEPQRLQTAVPRTWITIVATLAGTPPEHLTPHQFYLTLAKRGGYLARRHDPRPGWKVLWRGWQDLHLLVEGAELMRENCG